MNLTLLVQLEEFTVLLGCMFLFSRLDIKWWWFPILIMLPDLSWVGYLINPAVGAVSYNIVHFKGLGIAIGCYGLAKGNRNLMVAGIILLAHASMDRAIGTGLKYSDGFWHTTLSTKHFW